MKKGSIILVIIFILTGVIFTLLKLLPEKEKTIPFRIPVIDIKDADKVIIKKGGEKVVIEKRGWEGFKEEDGEGWEIVEPIEFPADKNSIKSFFRTFKDEILMDLLVSENKKDHATYETTEDKGISLTILDKDKKILDIIIGKSTGGGNFFLRENGRDNVYRAKLGAKGKFEKSYKDWMEKTIFDFKKEDISFIETQYKKKLLSFRALDEKGDEWEISNHPEIDPDNKEITQMARSIGRLKAAEVILEGIDENVFKEPHLIITTGLRTGTTHKIIIGSEKDDKEVYAKNPLTGKVYTVRKSNLRSFEKELKELRNKTIFNFKRNDVKTFSIRDGKKEVILAHENEKWKVVNPAGIDIPEKDITLSVNTMSNLRASNIADGATLRSSGIDKSTTKVRAEMNDGKVYELIIGDTKEDEKKRKEVYVKRSDKTTIYLIREYAMKNLLKMVRR